MLQITNKKESTIWRWLMKFFFNTIIIYDDFDVLLMMTDDNVTIVVVFSFDNVAGTESSKTQNCAKHRNHN